MTDYFGTVGLTNGQLAARYVTSKGDVKQIPSRVGDVTIPIEARRLELQRRNAALTQYGFVIPDYTGGAAAIEAARSHNQPKAQALIANTAQWHFATLSKNLAQGAKPQGRSTVTSAGRNAGIHVSSL